jgi:hypothetical protein
LRAAGYEQCQGKLLRLLERLVYLRDITPDYTYYGIATPWLQVRSNNYNSTSSSFSRVHSSALNAWNATAELS